MAKVSGSILACNQMNIGEQIIEAEKAGMDLVHIDIMDGDYVENMTFGPQLVSDMKNITDLPLSVHLEVSRPDHIFPMFAKAGADIITFQLDACPNPIHLLKEIRKAGCRAGIGIGPAYTVENLRYLIHHTDWLILMSVEPGYGGQKFEDSVYDKIILAKKIMAETGYQVPISVDGGVNPDTGKKLLEAGADILIAGSFVFQSKSCVTDSVRALKSL